MDENRIAKIVVDAAYQIHTNLEPGLLESFYGIIIAHELMKRNFQFER
jgi:GxxExxY protein